MEYRFHKFCKHCGKKLEAKYVFSHYDVRDGNKLYKKYLVCPSYRWWYAFLHDSLLVFGGSFGSSLQHYTEDYVREEQRSVGGDGEVG